MQKTVTCSVLGLSIVAGGLAVTAPASAFELRNLANLNYCLGVAAGNVNHGCVGLHGCMGHILIQIDGFECSSSLTFAFGDIAAFRYSLCRRSGTKKMFEYGAVVYFRFRRIPLGV